MSPGRNCMTKTCRRYPIGAELVAGKETNFRVWAPKAQTIDVALGDKFHPLARESDGYFSGAVGCGAGTRYKFRVNGGDAFPDPASRFQPDGPHGASFVIAPFSF